MIDSSAALAILLGKPEDGLFAAAIEADPTRIMSAVSVLEPASSLKRAKGLRRAASLTTFTPRPD